MGVPKSLILTGNGFNTQENLAAGFRFCGAKADLVPLQQFLRNPQILLQYQIWGIPGGFVYGDRISSGRIAAHLINKQSRDIIQQFLLRKGIVLGICNGFQVLVKMNLLPDPAINAPQATLTFNKNFIYENRWALIQCNSNSPSIWTKDLNQMKLPYLAREARLLIKEESTQLLIKQNQLDAVLYEEIDPQDGECGNGSFANIAGMCDKSGQILGILPHPEFVLKKHNLLNWKMSNRTKPDGIGIFENGVKFAKQWM